MRAKLRLRTQVPRFQPHPGKCESFQSSHGQTSVSSNGEVSSNAHELTTIKTGGGATIAIGASLDD